MDNKEYLNFEEATAYLRTTRSTLYKWLQAGKVPAHKLGRQWRFLRSELDDYLDPSGSEQAVAAEIQKLNRLFVQRRKQRSKEMKEKSAMLSPIQLKELAVAKSIDVLSTQIIADALGNGSWDIHFQPARGAYKLIYDLRGQNQRVVEFGEDVFRSLDEYWREISVAKSTPDARQFVTGEDGEYQVNYQSLDTPTGRRVTLRLISLENLNVRYDLISPDSTYQETMKRWCSYSHGIAVIAGPHAASGKTTSMHAAINESLEKDRIVFTFEPGIEYFVDGVNQIEINPEMSEAKIEELVRAVQASHPNTICLWEAGESRNMDTVLRLVYSMSRWCVIFIQMDCESADETIQRLNTILGEDVEDNLIGICTQRLVVNERLSDGKPAMRLDYSLYKGKYDDKSRQRVSGG